MTKPLSNAHLNYLIKDEAKASAEYKRLGFSCLSMDEARHRKFLMEIKAERKNG